MASTDQIRVYHLLGFRQRIGGIIPSIEGVVDAMDPAKFEQYLVVKPEYNDHRSERLKLLKYRFLSGEHPSYIVSVMGSILFVFATGFYRVLRSDDIIHCHSRSGIIAGYLIALLNRRIKIFIMPHGYMRHRWVYRLGGRLSNVHYVCLTKHLAEYYRYKESGLTHSIVSETCQPSFMAALGERGANSRVYISGFGTYTPRKGWHLVVEAVSRMPESLRNQIEIHIYGATHMKFTQDYKDQLRQDVVGLGLSGCIYLHETIRNVQDEIDRSDWCLMPSADEPCSVAIIEALSRGVPVIGTASGGTPEVIEAPAGGILFSRGSSEELGTVLSEIASGRIVAPARTLVRAVGAKRWPSSVAKDYTALYLGEARKTGSDLSDGGLISNN